MTAILFAVTSPSRCLAEVFRNPRHDAHVKSLLILRIQIHALTISIAGAVRPDLFPVRGHLFRCM